MQRIQYHLYTLWLFTLSDLKTIVLPSTIFALIHGVAASRPEPTEGKIDFVTNIPFVLLWTWLNLLPFDIDNQRQPDSVQEDTMNKPWRPLPSRRIRAPEAKQLMLMLYTLALIVSIYLGASAQCLALMFFGYCYNDLKGADVSPYIRNIINGFGYICFTSGALQVTLQGDRALIKDFAWWFLFIFMIICTTVQSQDLHDQEGDAARNRKTLPLVIGDRAARLSIAAPVICWSLVCPWLWNCSFIGFLPVIFLGMTVAIRTVMYRSVAMDKRTFQIWNLWLISVYCIPMMKSLNVT